MERRQPKHDTARKTIFSFFRRAEKMVFPKNSCGYMIFLVLSEKIMFLFPENMIWHLRGKMKDDLSQKKYTEIWHFLQTFLKDGLFRKGCTGHDLSCIISKDGIFFPKTWYFFLGQEVRDDLSQEIHRNMISWCHAPLPEKSKMVLSRKNAPKGDWRSRLTS